MEKDEKGTTMKIFTVHSVAVYYEEEDGLNDFLTFEDAYEYARNEVHETPILTMEEAREKFYEPRPMRRGPIAYVELADGISIGWVTVFGSYANTAFNKDDGVFERVDDYFCNPEDCSTCEAYGYCSQTKE